MGTLLFFNVKDIQLFDLASSQPHIDFLHDDQQVELHERTGEKRMKEEDFGEAMHTAPIGRAEEASQPSDPPR